jgi:hypothetical protein
MKTTGHKQDSIKKIPKGKSERKSKKDRQHNGQKKKGQKDKRRSTKQYIVN